MNLLKGSSIVVFDECHHVSAEVIFKIAMKCGNALLVGLSATPFRNYAPETIKIIAALGEVVYKVNIRDLIKDGFLCDAEIKILNYNNFESPALFDTYQDVVDKFIINNNERNNVITSAVSIAPKPCLVLVDRIEHGENLWRKLFTEHEKVVFVHGGSKDRKLVFDNIKKNNYDVIIASKIYGEGVNFPNLKSLIIAGGGKSSVATVQKIGRLLRLFPGKDKAVIYDIEDKIKFLRQHFKKRLEIYEENFEVKYDE